MVENFSNLGNSDLKKITPSFILIGVIYLFFLREYLPLFPYIIFPLSLVAFYFSFKLPKSIKYALLVGIWGLIYLEFGIKLSPEMGVSLLITVASLKLLEIKEKRDLYIIFLVYILLLNAGALFERTFFYFIFTFSALFILLFQLGKLLNFKIDIKRVLITVLISLPLFIFLYLVFPRFNYSLFGEVKKNENTTQGIVGISEDMIIDDIESLSMSGKIAFRAKLSKELPPPLYWRSHVLTRHNGWSWFNANEDSSQENLSSEQIMPDLSFEIFPEMDHSYFIGLDYPQVYQIRNKMYQVSSVSLAKRISVFNSVKRYSGETSLKGNSILRNVNQNDKSIDLPAKLQSQSQDFETLSQNLENYIRNEGFTYSLSPGKIKNLKAFVESKVGFCSHFSSLTALYFSYHGFPTRVVVGYLGGEKKLDQDYYLISQNDAHNWVEVWNLDKWIRIDPTLWIAQDRSVGLAQFLNKTKSTLWFKSFLNDINQYIDHLNFLFYVWLDQYNADFQLSFLKKYRVYLFIVLAFAVLLVLGFLILLNVKLFKISSFYIWNKFWMRFHEDFPDKSHSSIREARLYLKYHLPSKKHEKWLELLDTMERVMFKEDDNLLGLKRMNTNLDRLP